MKCGRIIFFLLNTLRKRRIVERGEGAVEGSNGMGAEHQRPVGASDLLAFVRREDALEKDFPISGMCSSRDSLFASSKMQRVMALNTASRSAGADRSGWVPSS